MSSSETRMATRRFKYMFRGPSKSTVWKGVTPRIRTQRLQSIGRYFARHFYRLVSGQQNEVKDARP